MYRCKFNIPEKELDSLINKIRKHRGFAQFMNLKCLIFFTKYDKGYMFFNNFQNYG